MEIEPSTISVDFDKNPGRFLFLDWAGVFIFWWYGLGMDLRGIPTAECMCGSDWFLVPIKFDAAYEIAMWGTDATCYSCGVPVTVCTPIDLPEDSK